MIKIYNGLQVLSMTLENSEKLRSLNICFTKQEKEITSLIFEKWNKDFDLFLHTKQFIIT